MKWRPPAREALGLGLLVATLGVLLGLAGGWGPEFRKRYPQEYELLRQLSIVEAAETDLEQTLDLARLEREGPLPRMRLELSPEAAAHLQTLFRFAYGSDASGRGFHGPADPERYERENLWVPGRLLLADDSYRVKVKAHGRTPSGHVADGHLSLSMRLRDRRQLWGGRRLNLIVGPRRHAHYDTISHLARDLGLLTQRDRPVSLEIDLRAPYLFYAENRIDSAEMEARGLASLVTFPTGRDSNVEYRSHVGPIHEKFLGPSLRPLLDDHGYAAEGQEAVYEVYRSVNEAVIQGRPDGVVEHFAWGYLVEFEALRRLLGLTGHGYRSHNFFVYFDQATGKLLPIVTRDHIPSALPEADIEYVLNQEQRSIGDVALPIARLISRHDGLRAAVYRRLYEMLQDPEIASRTPEVSRQGHDNLRRLLEQAEPEIEIALPTSPTRVRELDLRLRPRSASQLGLDRLALAVADAEGSQVLAQLTISSTGQSEPRTFEPVELRIAGGRLDLAPLLAGHRFADTLNPNCHPLARSYSLGIEFLSGPVRFSPEAAEIAIRNLVSGQPSPALVTPVDALPRLTGVAVEPDRSLEAFRDNHPEIAFELHSDLQSGRHGDRQDEILEIQPGQYEVTGDLVVPRKYRLRLVAGTKIALGPGRILWARGLEVAGTAEAPVEIRALDPERPFGSVAVSGGPGVQSHIEYLHLSGGCRRWFDGALYSGGLSIHDNDVVLRHSRIESNRCDDGLNIKYGTVELSDNTFAYNAVDQVDLDVCDGVFERSLLEASESSNGDGVDVSFSKMLIRDSIFRDLGDKGVSVGEGSTAWISDSTFEGNPIGIAAKDNSLVFVDGNTFEDSPAPTAAYLKKPIFGGAKFFGIDPATPLAGSWADPRSRFEAAPEWLRERRSAVHDDPIPQLELLRLRLGDEHPWNRLPREPGGALRGDWQPPPPH